ncbi:MAG: two-component sensor histidine kinase [Ignavibacteria bacterium GWB2_35_6b]|nr:MAG: two-component sensor histidine kinase [Ignavibacteria bacterium GWB2_35_6b]
MNISATPGSSRIKLLLIVIAVLIALGTLVYTQNLVLRLQEREKETVELYAKSLQFLADSEAGEGDYTFILDNVIQRINFPLILTDPNDKVSLGSMGGVKNLEVDSTLSPEELEEFYNQKVQELKKEHKPIIVTFSDSLVLAKIYYGDSNLVRSLRFYPYFQIFFAVAFLLIAYLSFNYMKKNEQSNIWVGMSKETAHQLGTPISSLMGWNELLKLNFKDPDKVLDLTDEMMNDLSRLNKIANRFSKIGSKPELKQKNIYDVISRVIDYFERRLPQTGKDVSLILKGDSGILIPLNSELFEWVVENLIKNALDAIETSKGKIAFEITNTHKHVEIEVTDNGKGIDMKRRKDIFRPGYSTKRRGWGLGLSLSKRIVEEYHKGKIFVKDSVINEGTTFKIILPKS